MIAFREILTFTSHGKVQAEYSDPLVSIRKGAGDEFTCAS